MERRSSRSRAAPFPEVGVISDLQLRVQVEPGESIGFGAKTFLLKCLAPVDSAPDVTGLLKIEMFPLSDAYFTWMTRLGERRGGASGPACDA
jgi:hypothetical protein